MQQYNCPSCGAEIKFQSSITVSAVCPYCRSLVVRRDKDIEAIGKMAEVPDDISPFQIGTTGRYKNIGFALVGRIKVGWEDGCWNEWFLATDAGRKGWMAEAQGALAINFELEEKQAPDHFPKLGDAIKVGDKAYFVSDIKETSIIASEGELPLIAKQGRTSRAVDLSSFDHGFASIEYNGPSEPIRIFAGEYVEFNDLHFGNLRDLPGWQVKRVATSTPIPNPKKKSANDGW